VNRRRAQSEDRRKDEKEFSVERAIWNVYSKDIGYERGFLSSKVVFLLRA